ncbi:glycosyltransferase family 4 protein [Streptomyces sp. NBC_00239]|uniref:glycosyltransferase family 4 protein n=1 Tax=Streptomyces sp. NBC_00239 TaxID=2903640 RepID=UPI002E2C7639|nr:glycosyltransferase family 4 protein [Streptomyces sp. NBC_00239]
MRICFVVKFPPTQGGVALRAALLAGELARLGHEIHVVTNAFEVADAYRIRDSTAAATSVTVVPLDAPDLTMRHIPQTDATVSRLAGEAARVIREADCEVVYSNYLEPCGVAAHIASLWTGVPHVVRSAGTDRVRLMNHVNLQHTYKEVFLGAAAIVAAPAALPGLGVERSRFTGVIQPVVPADLFRSTAAPLELAELAAAARDSGSELPDPARLADGRPVIGYYGKANSKTGLRHLVEALPLLPEPRPNVVALVGESVPTELRRRIGELDLSRRIWLLPFIPGHQVPGFLRACTAVALLEHDFPIRQHIPTKLRECFATGTAAVATRELIGKEESRNLAVHGENLYAVEDPTDREALARVLAEAVANPTRTRAVGANGRQLLTGETDLTAWSERYAELFQAAARRGGRSTTKRADTQSHPVDPEEVRLLLPLLAELLGPDFEREFTEFVQDGGAGRMSGSPARDTVLAAMAFAHHFALTGPQRRPEVVPLLWRAQAAFAWLTLDAGHHRGTAYFPGLPPSPGRPSAEGFPVRSGYVRLLHLPADELRSALATGPASELPRLREALATWSRSDESGPDGLRLLLHRLPNLETRTYRLGRTAEECIRLADGSTPLQKIAATVGAPVEAVGRLLGELAGRQAVRFLPEPTARAAALPDLEVFA